MSETEQPNRAPWSRGDKITFWVPIIAAVIATGGSLLLYKEEREARVSAERQLERFSEQEYQITFGEDWDLILVARTEAHNPTAVTITPVFDTPVSAGMEEAVGQPYHYDYDQIKVMKTHGSEHKQAILPQVLSDICARPGNIDRCNSENIRTVRVHVDFYVGDGFTSEVPAPS